MSTEAAVTTASQPELVTRSLDANWNYARWSQLPADGNRYEVIAGVLVLSRPDPDSGLYLQADQVAPNGELSSPTLPIRTPIADFFAGSPDETL